MNRIALALLSLCLAAGAAAAPSDPAVLRGSIEETLDAGGYTYLKIKTADGPRWAAVEKATLTPGAQAEVGVSAVMKDFESPLLKRRFDTVVFGVLLGPRPAQAASPHGPHTTAPDDAAPTPALKELPRPAGPATTVSVAALHARRAELKGKLVRVKGKVVKVNANILGRTWLHLRDGTGSEKKADNDLTATTRGTAAVGDEVSAEGVISLGKDLGSGYAFPVLLEDAVLSPAKR